MHIGNGARIGALLEAGTWWQSMQFITKADFSARAAMRLSQARGRRDLHLVVGLRHDQRGIDDLAASAATDAAADRSAGV